MLLDDELPGLTYLKMLCEQIPELEVVKAFDKPTIFLKEFENLTFDFCILDIEMPELNGLELSKLLPNKPVIFATAYKDYAADAFDLNAIDYLRKPISLDRLKQAISKVFLHIEKRQPPSDRQSVQLNSDKGKIILKIDEIAYFKTSEIDSRDKLVLLFNGKDYLLKNISYSSLSKVLPVASFCRINKKEMIALKAVQAFTYQQIVTEIKIAGKPLMVYLSDNYRLDFMNKLKMPS